jgi:hypothetical protein
LQRVLPVRGGGGRRGTQGFEQFGEHAQHGGIMAMKRATREKCA